MIPLPHAAFLSLFCFAVPAIAQGTEHDLRTTAKKGNTVWLLQENKNEQTIEVMGQEMATTQSTVRTLQLTVKDVDDKGNLIVETKIVRIHGAMEMPMMGEIEFDSAKPASDDDEDEGGMPGMPSPGQMTKAMTVGAGKTFVVKMSPHGKVVSSLEGVKELLADSGPGRMGVKFDESTMQQLVESAFGILPTKPVAVGGKWEHTQVEAASQMPMQVKMELTLGTVDAKSFEVTSTGTIEKKEPTGEDAGKGESAAGGEAMAEMMKSMKMKNGKMTGSQRVSREDGFVLEAKVVVSMDVEMSGQMGEMSMAMKQTSTMKRTTAEAAMPKAPPAPKKDDQKPADK